MKARMNIKSIILVMAIICFASMSFINVSFAANLGKINVETAKLRKEPNTDSVVLELASLGEEVEILSEEEDWYQVKYKKIIGYIRKDLIQYEKQAEEIIQENTTNDVVSENNSTSDNSTDVNVTTDNLVDEQNNQETNKENNLELGTYKVSENVKIKIVPLINAIELGEIAQNSEVNVTEIINSWAKVKTSDGKEGWIIATKLETKQEEQPVQEKTKPETQPEENTKKTMYVNSQSINVRKSASTNSEVIKQLTLNAEVLVLSIENGWAYVEIDGINGYISETLLSSTKQETSRSATTTRNNNEQTSSENKNTEIKKEEETASTPTQPQTQSQPSADTSKPSAITGNDIVAYAKQFLGYKYVYGGASTSGFDCSGFTQYVYKHFGISLNRTAAAQYSNGVSVKDLQAGDLVMFGKSGINHVGIYIGGNTFIHAANASRGVTTDTLASGYYKINYVGARRIIN